MLSEEKDMMDIRLGDVLGWREDEGLSLGIAAMAK